MRWRLVAAWNVLKACLLVAAVCAAVGVIGYEIEGYRLASLLVFFSLLVAGAAYWYGDRVVLGMVGARELPLGGGHAQKNTRRRPDRNSVVEGKRVCG